VAHRRDQGEHGLAIMVQEALVSEELPGSKWHQLVRVSLGTQEWRVMNVYIPNPVAGSSRRADAEKVVRAAIKQVLESGARLLVLGDWNTKVAAKEHAWGVQSGSGLARIAPNGGCDTFYYTGPDKALRSSALDHVLVPEARRPEVRQVRVDRWFDESDHWPLRVWLARDTVGAPGQEPGAAAPRVGRVVDREKLREAYGVVVNHVRWALPGAAGHGEQGGQVDINQLAEEFIADATEVARPFVKVTRAASAQRECGNARTLSREAAAACRARRTALREWEAVCGASEAVRVSRWQRYKAAKVTAAKLVRACHRQARLRVVTAGSALMVSTAGGAMRGWWRWVRNTLQGGQGADSSQLSAVRVTNPQGGSSVVTEPAVVREVIRTHYEALLRDDNGHSAGEAARVYWEAAFPGPALQALPHMDDEISWAEVNEALRVMRNGTAPGVDGVVPELLKAAKENATAHGFDPRHPATALGCRLLHLVRAMFSHGVPDAMAKAEVVLLYKKSGDPQVLDNYRGISLIPLCVKLVTKVVEMRIHKAMAEAGRSLNRRQAGFRKREECVAQTCALYEILRGQTGLPMNPSEVLGPAAGGGGGVGGAVAGEQEERPQLQHPPPAGAGGAGAEGGGGPRKAFATFVDFKKAYDLVPQEAMLRKLELFGVQGCVLQFVRSLYARSTVCVRTQWGATEAIQVRRGLRQGSPLSPLVFNIYVDDILAGCTGIAVARVPGGGEQTGVAFADDVTSVAASLHGVRVNAEELTVKQAQLEMRFGVAKCGVMGIGVAARDELRAQQEAVLLGGEVVPVVDTYTHLGTVLDCNLSTATMIAARATKGRGALHSLRPVLAARHVPICMQVRMINACLLPVLTFGAELWGIDGLHQGPVQKVLDNACFLVAGRRTAQRETILHELGLHSVKARTSGLVARAAIKYRTLDTIIADLCRRTSTPRGEGAWVQAAGTLTTRLGNAWLQRYPGAQGERGAPSSWSADLAKRRVRQLVGAREWTAAVGSTGTAKTYDEARLRCTRRYIELSIRWPGEADAVRLLMRLRLGAVTWAPALARAPAYAAIRGQLQRVECPCCRAGGVRETAPHFLLECSAWAAARARHIQPVLAELAAAGRFAPAPADDGTGAGGGAPEFEEASRLARHWAVLGGVGPREVDTWAPPADPTGAAEAETQRAEEWWLAVGPAGGVLVPPYIRVARFVAEAMRARWLLLRALCRAAAPVALAGLGPEEDGADDDDSDAGSVEDESSE